MKNYNNLKYTAVTIQIISFIVYQNFNMGSNYDSPYIELFLSLSSTGFLLSWIMIAYVAYKTPTSLRSYFRYYWRVVFIITAIVFIDFSKYITLPLWALPFLLANLAFFLIFPYGGLGYIPIFRHPLIILLIPAAMCIVSHYLDKNALNFPPEGELISKDIDTPDEHEPE